MGEKNMKKYFIVLLVVLASLLSPTSSKAAEVKWDGAQVVKGQAGKMTFTKDVKVYKKNTDGSFSSLTVKRNNYFRVYDIEKYDNKIFYWMSSGYRVQATDLVVFKEVPLDIRASFYDNPGLIYINRQDGKPLGYGDHLLSKNIPGSADYNPYNDVVQFKIGKKLYYYFYAAPFEGNPLEVYIDSSDIRIAEATPHVKDYYTLNADAQLLSGPMMGARVLEQASKGAAFELLGIEINGYHMVKSPTTWRHGYIPVKALQPVQKQDKRFIRYGVYVGGKHGELKRFDEVTFLSEDTTTALIEFKGEKYTVPKKALATIRPNESPVITSGFLPSDTLQQLTYNTVYTRTGNQRFDTDYDFQYITYHETDQAFYYEKDGTQYIFEKPITEGSKVTIRDKNEFVRAIHYTLTTPAGTFNNVVETSTSILYAPGYGELGSAYDLQLRSFK